jgi:glucose/arabinose dehydrogenase
MFKYRTLGASLAVLLLLSVSSLINTTAKTDATWPTSISLNLIATGFTKPVHITHAGDGSGRLFVVEQTGQIYILLNGNKLATPFLDIHDRVLSQGGEQGLLSVAFPPGFGTNRNHFYVYYTRSSGDNQVSRFRLSGDPNVADPGSEQLILLLHHPTYPNHNGGQLAFGPDGYLYIGTGDGGGGGDPFDNAQNPGSLLGKILRIDVEPTISAPSNLPHKIYMPLVAMNNGPAYSIPPDNPFVGQPGYRPEIWALGLRNPWRFSFDRNTGDLYIGDVGQGSREEIDFQPASSNGGENYGWNIMEGFSCYPPGSNCSGAGLTLPVHDYPHTDGCSVTGGFVYRGSSFPTMQSIYFYGDYCSGMIWGLQPDGGNWVNQTLKDTAYLISSFGEDQAGELYVAAYSSTNGAVYQIVTP